MPSFDIVKRSGFDANSFRVSVVLGAFDLQNTETVERFVGDIQLPNEWSIGIIVGASGTGKTTIARELFGDAIVQNLEYSAASVVDDMPQGKSPSEIFKAFNSVGFSSAPSYLKPYSVLSNGEKMRVDLARAILQDSPMFVFDEFTSVVDRTVAQISSYAIQKAVRAQGKQFVAITPHYDVEDWLLPDWVFDTNSMSFRLCEKKKRPPIRIDIYETSRKREYWQMFRKYHYLNHELNVAARVFVMQVNGEIAGFCAVLSFPHGVLKNHKRGHRLVIRPDYQGVGLGHFLSNWVGARLASEGFGFISTTSNPAIIAARVHDAANWQVTRVGRTHCISDKSAISRKSNSGTRRTVSFKFIGKSA